MNRRNFIQTSAFTVMSAKAAFGYQAGSALNVGLLGSGRRGTYVGGLFVKHEFARMGAICDIYDDQIAAAQKTFPSARVFKDYREMLRSDIDAVLIASPANLHPEHFEAAVEARKHIFLEKPAGVDPAGCRRVLAAAKKADKTKRISVDYQQRYGKDYRKVFERVKAGEFGEIKMVRGAWLGGGLPVRTGHPESEEKIRNWLFYREHSGDIIVEQDCHNLDVVNWFTGTHPVKAMGYGGRAVRKSPGNILDNLSVTFQFADGRIFSYSANQFSPGGYRDVGEVFICEKAVVHTSRAGYKIWITPQRGAPTEDVETKGDITQDAVNEFIDGARTGQIENAAFFAVESTQTAILGREAVYSGREMTWEKIA